MIDRLIDLIHPITFRGPAIKNSLGVGARLVSVVEKDFSRWWSKTSLGGGARLVLVVEKDYSRWWSKTSIGGGARLV